MKWRTSAVYAGHHAAEQAVDFISYYFILRSLGILFYFLYGTAFHFFFSVV